MKIFLFGSSANAKEIMSFLNEGIEIKGFIDNNSIKWGTTFEGYPVYSSDIIYEANYDYIIICIQKGYENVREQLYAMGVPGDKVIVPFAFERDKYPSWDKVFNLVEFVSWERQFEIERLQLKIENAKYELASEVLKNTPKMPIIRGFDDTLQEIVKNKKSISRFGDGEFDLMLGVDNSMQKWNNELSNRLKEILVSNSDKHLVAIPDVYGALLNRTEEFKDCFRKHLVGGNREKEYSLLDMRKVYYDAFISRPYKDYVDKSQAGYKFSKLKEIWKNRHITIVEGRKTRMGVGNNLFVGARTCNRIICPVTDAFEYYDAIINEVQKVEKKRLILIALGATATVLAYDLSMLGYQAIDIGHLDIEYEWFLHNSEHATAIKGKYTNEASGGRIVSDDILDEKYNKEVIGVIG